MQRRSHPDDFVAAAVSDATLTGLLVEEVLAQQSEAVRRFLLATSDMDSVCPELADALTDRLDSRLVLAGLHTGNVLTERPDATGNW